MTVVFGGPLSLFFVSTVTLSMLTACASATIAPERLATATASIRAADEVATDKTPKAALHVKLAQEELATAKRLANDGDAARAELYLQRSAADAEYALSIARQEEADAAANTAAQAVRSISGEK